MRWGWKRSLFYDESGPRILAELVLFVADIATFACAAFLATAIAHRPEGEFEIACFLLWIGIPRALARGLAWLERPREPLKAYAASAALIIVVTLLLAVGSGLCAALVPVSTAFDRAGRIVAAGASLFLGLVVGGLGVVVDPGALHR